MYFRNYDLPSISIKFVCGCFVLLLVRKWPLWATCRPSPDPSRASEGRKGLVTLTAGELGTRLVKIRIGKSYSTGIALARSLVMAPRTIHDSSTLVTKG